MMRHFYTQGVCASSISYEIKDGCLFDVKFEDGCPGNLQALGALVEGMKVEEVVRRFLSQDNTQYFHNHHMFLMP